MEAFEVRNRFTNAVQFTAQIACDPGAPYGVKLGLAVRWGRLNKANLSGAHLHGDKIARIFARVQRELNPYTFMGVELEAGGYKIAAGCRWFTDEAFRAHVAKEYPGTPKAEETLAILDFIAARYTATAKAAA